MEQSRWNDRILALALGITAAATVAACDAGTTEPTSRLTRAGGVAAIEGDTTQCQHGWMIINGVYVCKDPE